MAGYYDVMRAVNPQAFFMAELWGAERQLVAADVLSFTRYLDSLGLLER